MENKSGGFLVGRKNGKIYVHNQGDLGGILVGRRHSEGGIKGENKATGQPIEVETGEIQLGKNAVQSNKKQKFNGKLMTNREILSELNKDGGGIAFEGGGKVEDEIGKSKDVVKQGAGNPIEYSGGEVILTRGAVSSDKKYDYNGKQMTTREIASEMNVEAGGVAFSKGGDVKESDCGCTDNKKDGGVTKDEFDKIRLKMGVAKERHDHYDTLSKLNSGTITIEQALREIAQKEMKLDSKYPFGE
jgi:hypothetical protein